MQKFHVKRGDEVVVIAGSHKGKSGKVLEVLPAKQRARVEGVAMIKRHLRKSQEHPNGTIAEREGRAVGDARAACGEEAGLPVRRIGAPDAQAARLRRRGQRRDVAFAERESQFVRVAALR